MSEAQSKPDVLAAPLDTFNPLDTAALRCPHAFNTRMRREAPVYRCPHTGIVFVFDYDTVTAIAKDHKQYSNRFSAAMRSTGDVDPRLAEAQREGYPAVDTMLTQDPPVHRRYRGLVNQAFTARRVNTLEHQIESIANSLIDGFIDRGRVELVQAFAEPLPMTVIAGQLGVPMSDYELFKSWSDAFVAQLSRKAGPDEELAAVKLIVQFQHYFAERLEERRQNPRDDIISDIVHAKFEDERPLDVPESLSILQQLLVAGNETTTNAISEGVRLLIDHPDQHALLKRDPGLIPNLVEEVLRLSTPTANMWRVATTDSQIGGVDVPAGTMLMLRYSSANRDEAQFADPHDFDVQRANVRTNIAFGHGVHMCVGASLARKEMHVAFRLLLERLDRFELDCDAGELDYPPNVLLRGLSALPIRFETRGPG